MVKLKNISALLILLVLQAGVCKGQSVAVDVYPPALCEDDFESGRVAGVDLTLLESSIYSGVGATFTWYVDNGLTIPLPTPNSVTVSNFWVAYVLVVDGSFTDTAKVTYAVDPLPYIWDFTPPAMCEDVPGSGTVSGVNLTDYEPYLNGCSSTEYTWFSDAGFTVPITDPTNVTVSDGQVYYVELKNVFIFSYCTNTTGLTFIVDSKPNAFDLTYDLCVDLDTGGVTFIDLTDFNDDVTDGSDFTVDWYEDVDLLLPVADQAHYEATSGQTFYASVNNGSCHNESIVTVFIHPKPIADFQINPESTTMLEPIVDFIDLSSSNTIPASLTYSWDLDGIATITEQSFSYAFYSDAGNFEVELIVTDVNGCTASKTRTLLIEGEFGIYIPNTFTPNGDGINDIVSPQGFGIDEVNFTFSVFDRWGQVIFVSNSIDQAWDGTIAGKLVDSGAYVWSVEFQDFNEIKHRKTGNINVLR